MRAFALSPFILISALVLGCEDCKKGDHQVTKSTTTTTKSSITITTKNETRVVTTTSDGHCTLPKNKKPDDKGHMHKNERSSGHHGHNAEHGGIPNPTTTDVPEPGKKKCRHQLPTDPEGVKTGKCKVDYVKPKTEEHKGKTVPPFASPSETPPPSLTTTTGNEPQIPGTASNDGSGNGSGSSFDDSDENNDSTTSPSPTQSATPSPPDDTVPKPDLVMPADPASTTASSTVLKQDKVDGGSCAVIKSGHGLIWNEHSQVLTVNKVGGQLSFMFVAEIDLSIHMVSGFRFSGSLIILEGHTFFACADPDRAETDQLHAYPTSAVPAPNCQLANATLIEAPPKTVVDPPAELSQDIAIKIGITESVQADIHLVASWGYSLSSTLSFSSSGSFTSHSKTNYESNSETGGNTDGSSQSTSSNPQSNPTVNDPSAAAQSPAATSTTPKTGLPPSSGASSVSVAWSLLVLAAGGLFLI